MSKEKYTPEAIASAYKMPIEGLRVLRELTDAAQAQDSLAFLVRAHGELEIWIAAVRERYIGSASAMLNSAGARAELEMLQPFPLHSDTAPAATPAKVTGATGFQPNKEES